MSGERKWSKETEGNHSAGVGRHRNTDSIDRIGKERLSLVVAKWDWEPDAPNQNGKG